ncbi:hypothetical protein GCM10009642_44020 [Nocardiopsis metallicus]
MITVTEEIYVKKRSRVVIYLIVDFWLIRPVPGVVSVGASRGTTHRCSGAVRGGGSGEEGRRRAPTYTNPAR